MTPSSPCPVCGSYDASLFLETSARGTAIEINKCIKCKTRYLGNWQSHYSSELYDYYGDPNWIAHQRFDPITSSRYAALLDRFGSLTNGRTLLDVGCGAGDFVRAALKVGWLAKGIEYSEAAVALCQRAGLPVERADVFGCRGEFDVCTLFEVLEHVPEPGSFLKRVADLTKPRGLVLITVPNGRSIDAMIQANDWEVYCNEHITYFTPASLRRLIVEAGLAPISIRTRNMSSASIKRLLLGKVPVESRQDVNRALRERIEASAGLTFAKASLNVLLGLAGLGNAMSALCRKL